MSKTHASLKGYQADQREVFDRLITDDRDTYDDPWWDWVRDRETAAVFRHVRPRRILDVGCGVGYHDRVMAQMPGVEEVVGIDYSVNSVAAAERTYPHPRVRREVGDIMTMPSTRTFDLAISFQVIEHVTDPRAFLDACSRQVRVGGWVVALTPNRRRINNRIRRLLGLREGLEDPLHFAEYTCPELAAMGSPLGLDRVGEMAYGWSVTVPRVGWQLVPRKAAYLIGERARRTADRFGIVFQVTR